MMPADNRELIQRILQRIRTGASDLADQQMYISSEEFLCPQRLQRERKLFFHDTPQVVGFAGEVAAHNSYLTATVLDIPIVVTRAEDGILRAFINACAHRGARVAQGCGHARRLNCGFHGWSYALDGRLAGRRQADAFDTDCDKARLMPLPVSDRSGLIVVGLRPDMSAELVDNALNDIAPALAGFDFHQTLPIATRRIEVAANWKLVAGLSHESYHFATLHRNSLAPLMYDNAVFDTFGRHSRWAFALRGIEKLGDSEVAAWPDYFPGAMNHTIFPGTVIVVNKDDAEMIRVEPGEKPGCSIVHYSGVCRDESKLEACRAAYEFGGEIFASEDLPAAEQCQQGLAAGRVSVMIGRNEPVVQFWHRCWAEALGGA